MNSFDKSLVVLCLTCSLLIACQHYPPKGDDGSSLQSETAAGLANSKYNLESLVIDTMEYDGRDLNVRFFFERGKDPKQGIFWIDGEVFKLKFDKFAVPKAEESAEDDETPPNPEHLQQFVKEFSADKELRIIMNSESGRIQQPWYGDWVPSESGYEGKVDGVDAKTGKKISVLLSKKMNDYAIAHIDDHCFLLRFNQSVNGGNSKTLVFESEHVDALGKRIQPLIKLEVANLPVQGANSGASVPLGPAIVLKLAEFPTANFQVSAIKAFDAK